MKPEPNKKSTPLRPDADYLGDDLVFVISQPRSGSTLLQRLLGGHSDVQTSAETWLMLHPIYGMRRRGIQAEYRSDWAATGVEEFLEHYADGRATYVSGLRSFAQTIYGRVLAANNKKYFLDKTPRYTMIVPELMELFPRARYIILIRNPLAVLNSELQTYIGDKYWKLANFSPDLLDAPQRLVEAREICGSQGITIHYETLVTEAEDTIRKICEHLQIDYQPDMLKYGNRPAPVGTMNDPIGIHQHSTPTAGSLDKWTKLGCNSQHRSFALSYLDTLGPETLTSLGYDSDELEQEIRTSQIENHISPTYPWKLAMTLQQHHRFRDRVYSTYCLAAQKRGRLLGSVAALGMIANKLFGHVRRLIRVPENPGGTTRQ